MNLQENGETRQRLKQILLERSFQLGDFTLSSGKKSDYYIDCRTTTTHPEGIFLIIKLILPILQEWDIEQTGGLTLGADPIVSAIAYGTSPASPKAGETVRRPVPAFIVRKEAKDHGRGKLIEGCFTAAKRTAIIEDVITTGESALAAVRAAREGGAAVVGVIAVVDREEGGRQAIEKEGLLVRSLFTAAELKAAAGKK